MPRRVSGESPSSSLPNLPAESTSRTDLLTGLADELSSLAHEILKAERPKLPAHLPRFLRERLLDSPARQRIVVASSALFRGTAAQEQLLGVAHEQRALAQAFTLGCASLTLGSLAWGPAPLADVPAYRALILEALLLAADALGSLLRSRDGLRFAEAARHWCEDAADTVRVHLQCARLRCQRGELRVAADLAQQALDLAPTKRPNLAGESVLLLGAARGCGGDLDLARSHLSHALDLLHPLHDPRVWSTTVFLLGWFSLERGDLASAETAHRDLTEWLGSTLPPRLALRLSWLGARIAAAQGEREPASLPSSLPATLRSLRLAAAGFLLT